MVLAYLLFAGPLLGLLGLLCCYGIFNSRYEDNILERIGMCMLAMWCFMRMLKLPESWAPTEVSELWLYAALCLCAVGVLFPRPDRRARKRYWSKTRPASRQHHEQV